MSYPMVSAVPCNGCTLCCHGDAIRLLPSDNPSEYLTEPHEWMKGHLQLQHKANGDCIYLGESGCTIHGRSPLMCREMDCRILAEAIGFTKARTMNFNIAVWHKGRSLIKEAA